MYSSLAELPTQVKASLDDRDATTWMNAYNLAAPENPTEDEAMRARRVAWETVRTEPSSFSFCTKASVEVIDKDKEIIDVQSLKDSMDSFIRYGGNVQSEHGNYNVACIWGWDPITEDGKPGIQVWGNVFGGDIVYDAARQAFINGRSNLSVAGEADDGVYQCDDRGCYTRRHVTQLLEISLCTVPANRKATLIWYNRKAKLTKSASDLMLNVDSYEIHKDYTACPIQAIKKALRDAGFNEVHAKPNGCFVKVAPQHLAQEMLNLRCMGYWSIPTEGGLFVRDSATIMKNAFIDLRSKDYIDKNGYLTPQISPDSFRKYSEDGLIIKDDDGQYRLCNLL